MADPSANPLLRHGTKVALGTGGGGIGLYALYAIINSLVSPVQAQVNVERKARDVQVQQIRQEEQDRFNSLHQDMLYMMQRQDRTMEMIQSMKTAK